MSNSRLIVSQASYNKLTDHLPLINDNSGVSRQYENEVNFHIPLCIYPKRLPDKDKMYAVVNDFIKKKCGFTFYFSPESKEVFDQWKQDNTDIINFIHENKGNIINLKDWVNEPIRQIADIVCKDFFSRKDNSLNVQDEFSYQAKFKYQVAVDVNNDLARRSESKKLPYTLTGKDEENTIDHILKKHPETANHIIKEAIDVFTFMLSSDKKNGIVFINKESLNQTMKYVTGFKDTLITNAKNLIEQNHFVWGNIPEEKRLETIKKIESCKVENKLYPIIIKTQPSKKSVKLSSNETIASDLPSNDTSMHSKETDEKVDIKMGDKKNPSTENLLSTNQSNIESFELHLKNRNNPSPSSSNTQDSPNQQEIMASTETFPSSYSLCGKIAGAFISSLLKANAGKVTSKDLQIALASFMSIVNIELISQHTGQKEKISPPSPTLLRKTSLSNNINTLFNSPENNIRNNNCRVEEEKTHNKNPNPTRELRQSC